MRFTLHGLFRGITILAIASTLTAITMGRLAPRPTNYRIRKGFDFVGISGYHFATETHVPRFLDPATGRLLRVSFPKGEGIDCVSGSPWEGEPGDSQVVGRWVDWENAPGLSQGYGVARYTFPGGKLLDRVPLDVIPTSRPCFFPDSSLRILFTAGDGQLYRFTFPDAPGEPSARDGDDPNPRLLTWRNPPPGPGRVVISDPVWCHDSRLGGRVIASLCYLGTKTAAQERVGKMADKRCELWWLQLDPEGRAIVSAGRLARQGPSTPGREPFVEERLPNLATTASGDLVLAYLNKRQAGGGWELRLVPVEFDSRTGVPSIDRAGSRVLSESCLPASPVFSPDGRWLFGLERERPEPESVRRFSVAEALSRPEALANGLALGDGAGPLK